MIGIYDQEVDTSKSTGSQTDHLQFVPISVTVDNPTSNWLYFPETHKWIPPFTIGACFPWSSTNQYCEVDFTLLPTGVSQSSPIVNGTASIHYYNYVIPSSAGQTTQGSIVTVPSPKIAPADITIASGSGILIAQPRGPNRSLYLLGIWYDVGNEGSLWAVQDNNTPVIGTYWSCAANAFKAGYVPLHRYQTPNGVSLYLNNIGINSATIHFALHFDYNQTT